MFINVLIISSSYVFGKCETLTTMEDDFNNITCLFYVLHNNKIKLRTEINLNYYRK